MINGDTFYVTEEIEKAFKLSGITHLLAVSGSNITFIILATKFLFDKIFGKSFSNFVSILTIVLFVLICGASPSVVRSGIMAIILIISSIISKQPHTLSTIFITCLIMLIYNPYTICDVGFLLSFGGTLGIVLLNPKISKFLGEKPIFESISLTISAQIIILPIMWYYFNIISIISLLTNLLVGPIVSIITIFGIILYILGLIYFPLAKICSYSLYILVHIVIFIAKYLSQFSFGNIMIPTPSLTMIILYYVFVLMIFNENHKKIFKSIAITLSIIVSIQIFIPNKYCELNMIDVGQGDAIHIKTTHKKNILIDGGGSEQSDYDVGEKVLVPYLLDNSNGIIDLMIISHFHEDHAEGCISVLNNLKVRSIVIGPQCSNNNLYDEVLKIAKNKNIPIYTLKSKDRFSLDGVSFEVLYPNNEVTVDLNNNSLIIKATINDTSILFTGDAEKTEEENILNLYKGKNNLDVDILKVGHHGSRGSSTEEFLKSTSPKICLISCGVDNKFGHPHKEALERIEKYSNYIYRTDLKGEISLKIFNDHIKVSSIY